MSKLKILVVSPEVANLVSVGGIAEYVLGLASSLLRRGHDVRVAIPSYNYLRSSNRLQVIKKRLVVQLGVGASEVTCVREIRLDCPGEDHTQLTVLVVGDHKHFASVHSAEAVYQWPNHEPWIAFSRSVVSLLEESAWQPDLIHCNDSHTALVPVYLAEKMRQQRGTAFIVWPKTVLTIHNLLNQGVGLREIISYAGLPSDWFNLEGFEYFGYANCLKVGLLTSHRVNTVSPTYAEEICSREEFGFGLEGVLSRLKRSGRLTGILNGIDNHRWKMEGLKYDGTDRLEDVALAKETARQHLYSRWRWDKSDEPVIAFRARWDNQKGIGLLVESLEWMVTRARVIMVTWGMPGETEELRLIWQRCEALARKHPQRFLINPSGINGAKGAAAHYTLADFFLMPSKYEPCGLTQMECQRYGTVPIVRATGGLLDTVSEQSIPDFPSPNGFRFQGLTEDMRRAVERAIAAFRNHNQMRELIRNALRQDNGWDSRVLAYERLYSGLELQGVS